MLQSEKPIHTQKTSSLPIFQPDSITVLPKEKYLKSGSKKEITHYCLIISVQTGML